MGSYWLEGRIVSTTLSKVGILLGALTQTLFTILSHFGFNFTLSSFAISLLKLLKKDSNSSKGRLQIGQTRLVTQTVLITELAASTSSPLSLQFFFARASVAESLRKILHWSLPGCSSPLWDHLEQQL